MNLKQAHALSNMAHLLYDFLPGSGKPEWRGHVSFNSISRKLGLGHYWQEGSKEPAICSLLEKTFEREPRLFEKLILEIVLAGITYRKKNKNPVRSDDIQTLNGFILEVGFKFPALWDKDFLQSLDSDAEARARRIVETEINSEDIRISTVAETERKREALRQLFYELATEDDRSKAGIKLEKLLNELFEMFQLAPRNSFRVVGEQIDGSFQLDSETYLLEAKWVVEKLSEKELLVFRGKIEGKSQFTRGAFIAVNGFTKQCIHALTTGKQSNFFLMDGFDFTMVLEGQVELDDLLRVKMRRLAEEGTLLYRFERN